MPRSWAIARRTASLAAITMLCVVGCASGNPSPRRTDQGPAPSATEWAGVSGVRPSPQTQPSPAPDESAAAWVLHVGDSFVHAFLWQNLRPRFVALHTQYVVQATTATYTTTWASSAELEGWLARRPSLVLVTLGANEVDMEVPEQHARAIEALAGKIAATGAACVWITPPMWKRETGILEVIHDHSAPCLFFDSDAIMGGLARDERQPDGIHPNARGGGRWARAVWDWLADHRDPARGTWALDPFERRG